MLAGSLIDVLRGRHILDGETQRFEYGNFLFTVPASQASGQYFADFADDVSLAQYGALMRWIRNAVVSGKQCAFLETNTIPCMIVCG